MATVVEKEEDPRPEEDPRAGLVTEARSIDSILKDVYAGYKTVALSDEGLKDSFDLEGDTFFGDSPPTGHQQRVHTELEVDPDAPKKKRKAEVSLVVGSSS